MYTDPSTVAFIKRPRLLSRRPILRYSVLYTVKVNNIHEPQRLGIRVGW